MDSCHRPQWYWDVPLLWVPDCGDRPSGGRVVGGESVTDRFAQPMMHPHSESQIQSGDPGRLAARTNIPVQEMRQSLECEDWITQLEPLFGYTFEAGVQKALGVHICCRAQQWQEIIWGVA